MGRDIAVTRALASARDTVGVSNMFNANRFQNYPLGNITPGTSPLKELFIGSGPAASFPEQRAIVDVGSDRVLKVDAFVVGLGSTSSIGYSFTPVGFPDGKNYRVECEVLVDDSFTNGTECGVFIQGESSGLFRCHEMKLSQFLNGSSGKRLAIQVANPSGGNRVSSPANATYPWTIDVRYTIVGERIGQTFRGKVWRTLIDPEPDWMVTNVYADGASPDWNGAVGVFVEFGTYFRTPIPVYFYNFKVSASNSRSDVERFLVA